MSVLMFNTEDDAADTIKPRFMLAGGDSTRLFQIRMPEGEGFLVDAPAYLAIPHPVRVPECMGAQVPDVRCFSCPAQFSPESSVGIRQPTEFQRTSENPIAVRSKLCPVPSPGRSTP